MRIRSYREGDLPELVTLWNDARQGGYEFIPYTEEKLRGTLKSAHSTLVAVGRRGWQPFGVWPPQAGVVR